jgi:antitoxin component YwqK of YwqJK toxin-antitoxin module
MSYVDATPSLAQAIKMKEFSKNGKLSGMYRIHYERGKAQSEREIHFQG